MKVYQARSSIIYIAGTGIFYSQVALTGRKATRMPYLGLAKQGARTHLQVIPDIDQ
jgi:hypothetical protein